ncbi:MAG: hypothetical protein P4L22_03835 [Candidatus Babeliales bacterium]|nr:hypothetical protein [Candidatus Babeliales bacterium]
MKIIIRILLLSSIGFMQLKVMAMNTAAITNQGHKKKPKSALCSFYAFESKDGKKDYFVTQCDKK